MNAERERSADYRLRQELARTGRRYLSRSRDRGLLERLSRQPDKLLQRMVNTGQLQPVGAGRYLVVPIGSEELGLYAFTPQAVVNARMAGHPYFISHLSALVEHRLTDLDDPVVHVTVRADRSLRHTRLVVEGVEMVVTTIHKDAAWFGLERVGDDDRSYWRSDLERTLLDAVARPRESGSDETVIRGWARAFRERRVNGVRLVRYARQLGATAVRRTGFWLDQLGERRLANSLTDDIGTSGAVLLSPTGGETTYDFENRWRIKVNIPPTAFRGWIEYGK